MIQFSGWFVFLYGWKVISSHGAFKDAVFQMAPNIAPAGNSILWAITKKNRKI